MKKIFIILVIAFSFITTFAQNKDADAVKFVLKQYKDAVEKLDVTGTEKFFTTDSKIFESGSSEGSFAHYLEHHLRPEFKAFKWFVITPRTQLNKKDRAWGIKFNKNGNDWEKPAE